MGTEYFLSTFFREYVDKFFRFLLIGENGNVLSNDGKNQRSPGDGFGEHLRAAGAHRRLSPGPPVTRVGHFGWSVSSGGPIFDYAHFYSRPTGAYCHQKLRIFVFYRTPPGACLLVWCGGGRVGATTAQSCPGSDKPGGVISTYLSTRFCTGRGQCPRGKKGKPT